MSTRLTTEQIQTLKDELTTELTERLMEVFHYSMRDALDTLYTSETFERLQDDETGLYYQSPGYVFSFLVNELKKARPY